MASTNQIDIINGLLQTVTEKLDEFSEAVNKANTPESFGQAMIDSLDGINNGFANAGQSMGIWQKLAVTTFASPFINVVKFGKAISSATSFVSSGAKIIKNYGGVVVKHMLGPYGKAASAVLKLGKFMVDNFATSLKYATRFVSFMTSLPITIAAAAAEIGNSLRNDITVTLGNATEGIKEFLDISKEAGAGAGAAIRNFADVSKESLLEFRDVNSKSVRLFGEGIAGVTERMTKLGQRINEMGPFADMFGQSLAKSGKHFEFFEESVRSMGMQADDVSYLAREAAARGENVLTTLGKMKTELSSVAKGTGVNQKIVSKNFLTLQKDIVNFGHLSVSQLANVSGKLTKMGLEAKDAVAIFSKLDTFESAAQTAAMLSQSFGMNVDAFKLIQEEDPSKIFDTLRDSMMATGRSFEQLNRHEKSLLATTTGLDAASLKSLMTFRDAGMTYEESMNKMKESTPEAKQLKAYEDMTGSLKEMKVIMQDKSFFSAFFKGLRTSIVLGTNIGKKFMEVGDKIQETFLGALNFTTDKDFVASVEKAFAPIIGDNGVLSDVMLAFDATKLKSVILPFAKTLTDFLGDAFAIEDSKGISNLRDRFGGYITKAFNPNTFMSDQSNPAVAMFKSGGKLVGKFIKAFAALGPGIVDMMADAFVGVSDFLMGYGGSSNSIKKILMDVFQIKDKEFDQIYASYEKIYNSIKTKVVPVLVDLIAWTNLKLSGLMWDLGMELGSAIMDGMWSVIKSGFEAMYDNSPLGVILNFFGVTDSANTKRVKASKENATARGIGAESINQNFVDQLVEGKDATQDRRMGELIAILSKEKHKGGAQTDKLQAAIDNLASKTSQLDAGLLTTNMQGAVDKAIHAINAGRGEDEKIVSFKAKDWFSDLFGDGGKAVVQRSTSGMNVTSLASEDQILAGMAGGPIVDSIRYAGNAASLLLKKEKERNRNEAKISNTTIVTSQQGNSSANGRPIEVALKINGETLSKMLIPDLVANNIVEAMQNPAVAKGAKVLNDFATRNQAGGSNEISSLG
jgi:hypothetical protein